MTKQGCTESTVREIRRKTRKKYSAEEKIRIVLESQRGEDTITALCRLLQVEQGVPGGWQATSSW